MNKVKVGDKVTFKHGWGVVIDKRKDQLGYSYEYDVELTLGYQIVTHDGYIDDQSNVGKVFTTHYVELAND